MSSSVSTLQEVLNVVQATGAAVEVVCPGCKALVDLGELLAQTILSTQSTEAQQVAQGEADILAADAAAVQGLHAAHTPAPSASVQAVGLVLDVAAGAVKP